MAAVLALLDFAVPSLPAAVQDPVTGRILPSPLGNIPNPCPQVYPLLGTGHRHRYTFTLASCSHFYSLKTPSIPTRGTFFS